MSPNFSKKQPPRKPGAAHPGPPHKFSSDRGSLVPESPSVTAQAQSILLAGPLLANQEWVLGADHPDTWPRVIKLARPTTGRAARPSRSLCLSRRSPTRSGCEASTTPKPWPRAITSPPSTGSRGRTTDVTTRSLLTRRYRTGVPDAFRSVRDLGRFPPASRPLPSSQMRGLMPSEASCPGTTARRTDDLLNACTFD